MNSYTKCSSTLNESKENSQSAEINTTFPDVNVNKIFLFEAFSNLFVLAIAVIISFLPIVKIGTSSLGNTWEVIANFFENIPQGTKEQTIYFLNEIILILPAGIILFSLLYLIGSLILALLTKNNERYCYSVINHSYVVSIVFIIFEIFMAVLFVVVLGAFYSIFSQNVMPISILIIAVHIRKIIADFYYCKLINSSPDKINENKKYKTVEGRLIFPKFFLKLFHLAHALLMCFIAFIVSLYFGIFQPNLIYSLIPDSSIPTKLTNENANEYHVFYNSDACNQIISSTRPETKRAYSFNYLFFNNFIEATEEKIEKSIPDDLSENEIKKYTAKIEALKNDIEIAKKMRDKHYLYTETVVYSYKQSYNFSVKMSLNTNCKNDSDNSKWGNKTDWYRKDNAETITLSKTVFTTRTDFRNETIFAYITYSDGSCCFSMLSPTNIEELNNAGPGTYTLTWSDEWGTYEHKIIIKQ